MNLLQLMKERYSCRNYSDREIDKETLDYILEAGRVAPTGANKQPQRILVVNNRNDINNLNKAVNTHNPTTMLIVCSDTRESWVNPYDGHDMNDIDCSIVSTHMMLAAKDRGIDSVWLNWFDPEIIYKELDIPREYKIVNLLSLGYANKEPKPSDRHESQRKPYSETIFYNRFN